MTRLRAFLRRWLGIDDLADRVERDDAWTLEAFRVLADRLDRVEADGGRCLRPCCRDWTHAERSAHVDRVLDGTAGKGLR